MIFKWLNRIRDKRRERARVRANRSDFEKYSHIRLKLHFTCEKCDNICFFEMAHDFWKGKHSSVEESCFYCKRCYPTKELFVKALEEKKIQTWVRSTMPDISQ